MNPASEASGKSEALSHDLHYADNVAVVHTLQALEASPSPRVWLNRRVLTPRQAAEMLGCDEKTVTRWSRQRYIPAHPIGQGKRKFWRFFEDELMDWLNGQTNGALAA